MPHKAKKSLGQHFLRSASALRAIVAAGKLAPSDIVLEIGPGEGALTRALLDAGVRVIAVEKDRELIPHLHETFAKEVAAGKLVIVLEDILKFEPDRHGLLPGAYKLIANIPYYITGAIFEKFLTEKCPPSLMVLLIQKEVATRIVARDSKESILSLSVKAFGTPRITAKVPASAFRPEPKVDSAILSVENISRGQFADDASIDTFFAVVHAGFAHKRKLLLRNLETTADKKLIEQAFAALGLSSKARAEDLPLALWIELSKMLAEK